ARVLARVHRAADHRPGPSCATADFCRRAVVELDAVRRGTAGRCPEPDVCLPVVPCPDLARGLDVRKLWNGRTAIGVAAAAPWDVRPVAARPERTLRESLLGRQSLERVGAEPAERI